MMLLLLLMMLLMVLLLVVLLIVRGMEWMVATEGTVLGMSQVPFHRRSYDDATGAGRRTHPGRGLRRRRLGRYRWWCPFVEATAKHEPVHLPIE
uniref:Putative secreted peptide n=1 Tax=Anopheles braziliensis TaxID=58242 RepID=A0A2M3ZRE3_9DIPT